MHLYNAWLPPPIAEETKREKESFARVVRCVKDSYRPEDPESVFDSLEWISVIDLFVDAKSELSLEDVGALVESGFHLFYLSKGKLLPQVRWGNMLVTLIEKYGKKLSLKVQWRPLYETLIHTHFERDARPEGWVLRQRHFTAVTSLVQHCRRFFPQGSAFEIWSEFRSLMENPWNNSSFEGSGFVRLFLPANSENRDFFSDVWMRNCLDIWDKIPNCYFWNSQWAAVIARVVKNYYSENWESYLPTLFSRFLNMFEVPIANASGSYSFPIGVPLNLVYLFSNETATPTKAIAKSIVYLLKPRSSAQEHFEKLVSLIEQYYHPSNGGKWTYSLDSFLLQLVETFLKRLQHEQQNLADKSETKYYLGKSERTFFVNAVLKLTDRGQYSKNESLSETVASTTSILSYIEPSLVLPFLVSRFHMALETSTATHQLRAAVMSVACAGRSILVASLSTCGKAGNLHDGVHDGMFGNFIAVSLSNALLGMDANDPPKTMATMQLVSSIFSNMATLDDDTDEFSLIPMINFSEWLDEFLSRLFSLLINLEQSSVVNEGQASTETSGSFLLDDDSYYYNMLAILLSRLPKPLYNQAVKKISKFVRTNIVRGASFEVGMLCCACVQSHPEEAVAHLVEPMLQSVIASLKETPGTGYGGRGNFNTPTSTKGNGMLSTALESIIGYRLEVLSVAIYDGGYALLRYKDQLKETIFSAFESPSWKVNEAGSCLLQYLLRSLVLYYPIDQYKCLSRHPAAAALEEWLSTKDYTTAEPLVGPKWHLPNDEEIKFANELLYLHFQTALDDLLNIFKTKMHSDMGNKKEHLKSALLRILSSLRGVFSCLPDFKPSSRNGMVEDSSHASFLIAGVSGTRVGSAQLREKATETMHTACEYLLAEKSDDSILLTLVIRIMDILGNYGSLELDELSNQSQSTILESASAIEPPVNFIVGSHSKGKRRPGWALIDLTYMHHLWRASQSSYYLYRSSRSFSPASHLILLMDDVLKFALHSYATVRVLARKSLYKMIKRWPSLIPKCVLCLTDNLRNPDSPEHIVLGSCAILSLKTVIKHLTMDSKAFSAFLIGILSSYHHQSLKVQKCITELFVEFNNCFAGVSRSTSRSLESSVDGPEFSDLFSQILTKSFDSTTLHWRYNLMANRALLLLAMASGNNPNFFVTVYNETTCHFLKILRSQLLQTRVLAISALNILLKESPKKMMAEYQCNFFGKTKENSESVLAGALTDIFHEDGFFNDIFSSLSHIHLISDSENESSSGNYGSSFFQNEEEESMTRFYFYFSASWPRTPSWISVLENYTFYSPIARVFKRLTQECGLPVLLALKIPLEEFANSKEMAKQCVAAEVLAGMLHSDVKGLLEVWNSWLMLQLQNIILAPSVESIPNWAACVRYAVSGKGKCGTRVPVLRQQILDCLMVPLPLTVTSTVVAKRYAFLSAALIELSPPRMSVSEIQLHITLLKELLCDMCHSSAQVREAVGVTLSVLCSNLRLYMSCAYDDSSEVDKSHIDLYLKEESWLQSLTERACKAVTKIQKSTLPDSFEFSTDANLQNGNSKSDSQDDIKWMETLFHFVISTLKSGRSSYLLDVIVGLLYPVISLQETSNNDLSRLAKVAFKLFRWRVFQEPHLQNAVSVILSSANDMNWRTRSATLTYVQTFVSRHTFILSSVDKRNIWNTVEKLLSDNQVEVREHAATVLARLMKSADEDFARDFRERAYLAANSILTNRKRKLHSGKSIASVHGAALALVATVLSVPYDVPSWLPDHLTLLAGFVTEPNPVKSTVTKAVAEFRRTHADTWVIQKETFTQEQLEVLADTSSSSSYFA